MNNLEKTWLLCSMLCVILILETGKISGRHSRDRKKWGIFMMSPSLSENFPEVTEHHTENVRLWFLEFSLQMCDTLNFSPQDWEKKKSWI